MVVHFHQGSRANDAAQEPIALVRPRTPAIAVP